MTGRDATAAAVAAELGIRPLNTRSVVLSALLGTHPPEMPVAALVELGTVFGIPAGTLRTALSRMTAAGEVAAADGRYRLAGRLVDRQREQVAGLAAPAGDWDGAWWTATFAAGRPLPDRRRARSTLTGARLAELRPGVWMRPANIPVTVGLPDAVLVRGAIVEGDPVELVARLWDLDASEARASVLRDALTRWSRALDGGGDEVIAPAFTAYAACLQFLRAEPQVPTEIAASPAARALRADYARSEPVLRARLRKLATRAVSTAER